MQKFKALEIVRIVEGIVGLAADQYKRRKHLVEEVGENLFKILQPVTFKAGEEFEYDGNAKPLANKVVEVTEEIIEEVAETEEEPVKKKIGIKK